MFYMFFRREFLRRAPKKSRKYWLSRRGKETSAGTEYPARGSCRLVRRSTSAKKRSLAILAKAGSGTGKAGRGQGFNTPAAAKKVANWPFKASQVFLEVEEDVLYQHFLNNPSLVRPVRVAEVPDGSLQEKKGAGCAGILVEESVGAFPPKATSPQVH